MSESVAALFQRFSARSSDVLGDCLDAAKALKTVNPKVIEHDPPSGP